MSGDTTDIHLSAYSDKYYITDFQIQLSGNPNIQGDGYSVTLSNTYLDYNAVNVVYQSCDTFYDNSGLNISAGSTLSIESNATLNLGSAMFNGEVSEGFPDPVSSSGLATKNYVDNAGIYRVEFDASSTNTYQICSIPSSSFYAVLNLYYSSSNRTDFVRICFWVPHDATPTYTVIDPAGATLTTVRILRGTSISASTEIYVYCSMSNREQGTVNVVFPQNIVSYSGEVLTPSFTDTGSIFHNPGASGQFTCDTTTFGNFTASSVS